VTASVLCFVYYLSLVSNPDHPAETECYFFVVLFDMEIFFLKAQKELSVKDKMLFIQQITNINKYSIFVLIAASVLFFTCVRQFNLSVSTMIPVYFSVVIIYTAVVSFFISKEINHLRLPLIVNFQGLH
jgi:hypothetical protein